jgi:hypothetical protein
VIILDGAIGQVASGRLNGEPMLFRDCAVNLREQLQMADKLSEYFNSLANVLGVAEISPEELQSSLQSEIDRQFSIWINLDRVAVLGLLGSDQEMHVAMDRYSNTFQPNIEVALFQVLTISSDLMPEIVIRPLLPGQILLWKVGVSLCGLDLVTNPEQTVKSLAHY